MVKYCKMTSTNDVISQKFDIMWKRNFLSISYPVFDLWRHLLTSFCNISPIWPLDRLFEQLNLIITKYLWVLKLFIVTRGTFRKRMFLIQCLIYDLWRHLLTSFCSISLILPLYRLFEQLHAIFMKYL